MTYALLSGSLSVLCLVSAAFFFRSFARTHDRLFVLFGVAFSILGASQFADGLLNQPEADLPLVYIPRLASSVLILVAIAGKNRAAKKAGTPLRLVHSREPERHRRALP